MSGQGSGESALEVDVLCKALVRMRIDRGLAQREVASRAGLTRPMLSAYEHGRVEPKLRTLLQILQAMDTDLSHLSAYMEMVAWGPARDGGDAQTPRLPEREARRRVSRAVDDWLESLGGEVLAAARQGQGVQAVKSRRVLPGRR